MLKLQLIIGIAFFVGILHVSGLVKLPLVGSEDSATDEIADLNTMGMSDEVIVAKVRVKATTDANLMLSSFVNQVKGTGLGGLLSPQRVIDDPGLRESAGVLGRVRDLIAQFEEINYDRINDLRDDIDGLDIDPDAKDQLMTDVNFHYGGGGEFKRLLNAQDKVVDSVSNALDVLRDTQGRWSYRSSQLKFDRTTDQATYDLYVTRMTKAEQELTRRMRDARR